MTSEPYASARRVFWIVDNGSSHNGQPASTRLERQWPNLRLIHLPTHASWLNQIEIYFSILQRKALTPNDFPDLAALTARISAFEEHYRQIARPFDWTFHPHRPGPRPRQDQRTRATTRARSLTTRTNGHVY
jgi:hypothetical protein